MPDNDSGSVGDINEAEAVALESMIAIAKRIADVLNNFLGDVRIVSHYDADGVSSASIMVKALARAGKGFHLSFIKQLYEDDIRGLAAEGNKLTVFLDMGSGQLGMIQEHLLEGDSRVIVIDHHQMQGEITRKDLMHLNPTAHGIQENISGSGTTYLVARAMSPENKELAELAIVGAIGDSQTGSIGPHWGLFGLNKEIMKDAQSAGKLNVSRGLRIWGRTRRPIHKALEYSVDPLIPGVSGSESGAVQFLKENGIEPRAPGGGWKTLSSLTPAEMKRLATGIIKERISGNEENPDWIFGEVYELPDKDGINDANEFATILNSAGKQGLGYIGVALCLNNKDYFPQVEKMLDRYRREIGKSLRWVGKNREVIRSTDNSVYILAGENVPEHVASNVVSIIVRGSDILDSGDSGKPVFMMVENQRNEIKVSARASDEAVEKGFSLQEVVADAAGLVGGEGGGHMGAAGANIPKGTEEMFINRIEEIMKTKTEENDKSSNNQSELDGSPESKGTEREEEGREAQAKAAVKAGPAHKEAERKGLVRYLGT